MCFQALPLSWDPGQSRPQLLSPCPWQDSHTLPCRQCQLLGGCKPKPKLNPLILEDLLQGCKCCNLPTCPQVSGQHWLHLHHKHLPSVWMLLTPKGEGKGKALGKCLLLQKEQTEVPLIHQAKPHVLTSASDAQMAQGRLWFV